MDEMVLLTQQWLNSTYSGRHGYETIPENGKTGWTTVYALTRALQIELGIAEPSDTFGDQTSNLFSTLTPGMEGNQIYILQGALWCKGIAPGSWTGEFDTDTATSIQNFKSDAGIASDDASVNSTVMKALLNMSAFVLVSGGNSRIRTLQQNLNHDYLAYTGLQACDGLYGRQTNTALIYALQAEEGLSTSVANGTFGPSTTSKCPTLQPGDSRQAFVKILQYALCVNNFYDGDFDGIYSESVTTAVSNFQKFMVLPKTGIANMTTIKGLLSSAGDTNRDALACDTATILTATTAQAIKRAGFNYVGRYLTGTVGGEKSKAMTNDELEAIFEAGLKVFAIYENNGTNAEYFNFDQGITDAQVAVNKAKQLGIPRINTLYFAVDFDAIDDEITNNIIPYFQGIAQAYVDDPAYTIGVYGTRNVCQHVSNIAIYSFVADMSTGWSGNLGFKMPQNWGFDQFRTITVGNSSLGYVEVDMDGYSDRDPGFDTVIKPSETEIEAAQKDAAQDFINTIPNLKDYFASIALQFEVEYMVVKTPFLEVDVSFSGTITTKSSEAVSIRVKNGDTLESEFNVMDGLDQIGGKANIDMTNPKSILNELAASVNNGSIQIEIEQPKDPNGVLTVSLTAVIDKIPVISQPYYDTGLELKITYKFSNSTAFPNITLPDTQQIYDLKDNEGQANVNSGIVYQAIGAIQNIYGFVDEHAETIGMDAGAAAAIAVVITILISAAGAAAVAA
ncbi:DUF1906 domain-containing protein [Sporolactobacillus shoreicorticis]|uniref:Glycoside hydrolase domain-containing protein n=1 Tax=Sporolactobacillus shoreicorticis TaxID=1923877 RepID=A0ABW5S7D3_9BACL|nr:glycoside hydrolase domain-containing protein [Sporolactobacillus shoreicorticis]MCO7125449.1 DUF1906 domain-containing protein [Sporolactobacillus shoreicorticis]